jgi:DNA-nicking Smr family endonuclease
MTGGADDEIWQLYAKGVKKLAAEKEAPLPPKKKPKKQEAKNEPLPEAWTAATETKVQDPLPLEIKTEKQPPKKEGLEKEPLDLRVERNLSLGDVVIEGRLDLHGLTESEAHEQLLVFIEAAFGAAKACARHHRQGGRRRFARQYAALVRRAALG